MGTGSARILIAGGGVAGLEALLGLRHLAGPSADIQLLAPDSEFVLRPLLIGEPFGLGEAMRLDLDEVAQEHGARFRRAALSGVDPRARSVRIDEGATIDYDALLLAIGTRCVESVPGAIHFGAPGASADFAKVLAEAEAGHTDSVLFVAPSGAKWSLAIYELALLTAAHLSERGTEGVDLTVVTHESEPLGVFGAGSPAILRQLLDECGVDLRTSSPASHVEAGQLHLTTGEKPIRAGHVVALPGLEVPELPGVPQRASGFIPTDTRMNVEGMSDVWAAGDATWFPIKQGGLAAQQADVAAASIASHLGVSTPVVSYRPVLRGALLTGTLPHHFRNALWGSPDSEESVGTLWWPPGKLAGRYLGPYLAERSWSLRDSAQLSDLDPVATSHDDSLEREQMETLELALTAAGADAREGDLRGALEWLRVAEEISLVLPPPWPERRSEWLRALGDAEPAGRVTL